MPIEGGARMGGLALAVVGLLGCATPRKGTPEAADAASRPETAAEVTRVGEDGPLPGDGAGPPAEAGGGVGPEVAPPASDGPPGPEGGAACQRDDSPRACGPTCQVCSAPAGAEARCNGGTCGWVCAPGTCPVGGACLPASSPERCGPTCSPCQAPEGATPVCTASGACDFTCAGSTVKCQGACFECCDSGHCTRGGPLQTGTCADHLCTYRCTPGAVDCAASGAPDCRAFVSDLDGGGLGGWSSAESDPAFGPLTSSSTRAYSGFRSLASTMRGDDSGTLQLTRSSPCAPMNLAGRRLSFRVFWDGPSLPSDDQGSGCEVVLSQGGTVFQAGERVVRPLGRWYEVTTPNLDAFFTRVSKIALVCVVNRPWSGTVYIDDIEVE